MQNIIDAVAKSDLELGKRAEKYFADRSALEKGGPIAATDIKRLENYINFQRATLALIADLKKGQLMSEAFVISSSAGFTNDLLLPTPSAI